MQNDSDPSPLMNLLCASPPLSWDSVRPGDSVIASGYRGRLMRGEIERVVMTDSGEVRGITIDGNDLETAPFKLLAITPRAVVPGSGLNVRRQAAGAKGGLKAKREGAERRERALFYLRDQGRPLRVCDVARFLGVSDPAAHAHLQRLMDEGSVGRDGERYEALRNAECGRRNAEVGKGERGIAGYHQEMRDRTARNKAKMQGLMESMPAEEHKLSDLAFFIKLTPNRTVTLLTEMVAAGMVRKTRPGFYMAKEVRS